MKSRLNFRNYFGVALFTGILWTALSGSVLADCELAKLLASDGAMGNNFGYSVGVWGDTAVIGSYGNDDNGAVSGSAYIFRFNGTSWVEEAKLLASDGAAGDYFGWSVGIWGDTAVIGAEGDDDKGSASGSVYIFRFNGSNWVEEAKLLALDGAAGDFFGGSVGIYGNTVIIGAEGDNSESGSAYIFKFSGTNWVQKAKLFASDYATRDYFGYSVGISDGNAVIGAYGNDDNGGYSGSAYIFRFNGTNWVEDVKLLASDGAANDYFGISVGIWDGIAVIGAYGNDDNGEDSGSAYIFRFNGTNWAEDVKLLASDGAAGDFFGNSVGISGDTAIIGAYQDDDSIDSGSAYIFHFNDLSWVEDAKLLASEGDGDDYFGRSVGISGITAIVGAPGNDDNGDYSGSAYIFGLSFTRGDLDLDNDVDLKDYSVLTSYWLASNDGLCRCTRADFTRDGGVDYRDLKELCNNWLAGK